LIATARNPSSFNSYTHELPSGSFSALSKSMGSTKHASVFGLGIPGTSLPQFRGAELLKICPTQGVARHGESTNNRRPATARRIPVTFSHSNRIVHEIGEMVFSEIYGRYARDVHRFSLYLSGDFALAEDLTSETFVHALCGPTSLHVDTVKAYLFAIARNLYRDVVERQRRLVPISAMPERPDPAPSPDRAAEDRQMLTAVLKAIQRLPAPQREALVLSLDDDLRYEQISAILGCSVAAVKVRIHRARLQLRSDLPAQEREHGKRYP
jgi:RNA polymerase sigma-70 factor, ECF subfamily